MVKWKSSPFYLEKSAAHQLCWNCLCIDTSVSAVWKQQTKHFDALTTFASTPHAPEGLDEVVWSQCPPAWLHRWGCPVPGPPRCTAAASGVLRGGEGPRQQGGPQGYPHKDRIAWRVTLLLHVTWTSGMGPSKQALSRVKDSLGLHKDRLVGAAWCRSAHRQGDVD